MLHSSDPALSSSGRQVDAAASSASRLARIHSAQRPVGWTGDIAAPWVWATTTLTGSITGTILDVWIVWSSNPMKNSKVNLERKSANILRRVRAKRAPPTRVGIESMDSFFSRMKDNARKLDRGRAVEPGFHVSVL